MISALSKWFRDHLGMNQRLAIAFIILTLLVGGGAINFGARTNWVSEGSPWWAVGMAHGFVMFFLVRHWRHRRFQLTSSDYRCFASWHSLSLGLVLVCALNLIPIYHWKQLDGRLSIAVTAAANSTPGLTPTTSGPGSKAQSKAGEVSIALANEANSNSSVTHLVAEQIAPSGAAEKLKEVQEDVNRWGTLFAWLLAVVALVIAFVTTWVFALSREVKEQLDATKDALDLNAQYGQIKLAQLSTMVVADLLRLLEVLDVNRHHADRMVVRYLLDVVRQTGDLFGSIPDIATTNRTLQKTRTALEKILPRAPHDPRLRLTLRDRVLPCMTEYHDSLSKVASLQTDEGRFALGHFAAIARLCRDF